MIIVTFPDRESLKAAVTAVAAVVSAEGATDDSTPAAKAEFALDSALLAEEEHQS